MKTRTYSALMAISVGLASLSTSQASLISYFADGTDNDVAALTSKVAPLGATVSALSVISLSDGAQNITRTSFTNNEVAGSANLITPAGPTAGSSAESQWLAARSNTADGLLNPPSSTTDYFGFIIAGTGGNTLNLNAFKFDMAVMNTSGATTANAALMVSVDGGAFSQYGTTLSLSQAVVGVSAVTTKTIDLSSITGANSVEFRLNVSDNRGLSVAAHVYQGLQLDGSIVSVPEPTTMALVLLGGMGLLAARRKTM